MTRAKQAKMQCELTTDPRKRAAADELAAAIAEAMPAGLSQPALRALAGAGIESLEHLTGMSEAELLALHGMGPKGVATIQAALAAEGLALAKGKKGKPG